MNWIDLKSEWQLVPVIWFEISWPVIWWDLQISKQGFGNISEDYTFLNQECTKLMLSQSMVAFISSVYILWFLEQKQWWTALIQGRCNIVTFGKKCVIFLSEFRNPASITLCTNVLSVYQAQNYCTSPKFLLDTNSQGYRNEQVLVLNKDKVQNRWNYTPGRTIVLGSGEKSRSGKQNKIFELELLISAS